MTATEKDASGASRVRCFYAGCEAQPSVWLHWLGGEARGYCAIDAARIRRMYGHLLSDPAPASGDSRTDEPK